MTDRIESRSIYFKEVMLNDDGSIMRLNQILTALNPDGNITVMNLDKDFALRTLKAYDEGEMELFETNRQLLIKSNVEKRHIKDLLEDKKEEFKIKEFFNMFLDKNTKERLFVLMGETGVGKSYLIEQELPNILQYACNSSLDPYTLCYELKDDGNGLKPVETPFLNALKNGGKVFLDEMNELPMDTLMFIQGITDEKKSVVVGSEHIDIHEEFRIIGSLNPPSATDERRPLGDALLGRAVGFVLELTDELMASRIGCTTEWINQIRKLHNFMRDANFTDLRALNFRDFQKFYKYDFKQQYKFKVCMGDVLNINEYMRLSITHEFEEMIKKIERLR